MHESHWTDFPPQKAPNILRWVLFLAAWENYASIIYEDILNFGPYANIDLDVCANSNRQRSSLGGFWQLSCAY